MVMWVSPETLGRNLFLLIGVLIAAGVGFILIVVFWTSIKVALWHRSKKRLEQREHERRHAPGGQPYPPTAAGLCDRCGRGFESVYYLPSGCRLCPNCYGEQRAGDNPLTAER